MTLNKNKILTSIKIFFILFFLFCAIIVSGCILGSGQQGAGLAVPKGLSAEPAIVPQFAELRSNEGSLFSGQSRFYFEDTKASMVGDTVVVDIIENSSSNMKVSSDTSKKSNFNIGIPNWLGKVAKVAKRFEITDPSKLIETTYDTNHQGEGESERSGQVTASIAARITEVLPNGNLSLFGRRVIKANNETQYITVSGIIRPEDISSDNRVKSISLADSRIEYYGKGQLADKQRPGWGVRLFDNLWPF